MWKWTRWQNIERNKLEVSMVKQANNKKKKKKVKEKKDICPKPLSSGIQFVHLVGGEVIPCTGNIFPLSHNWWVPFFVAGT